MSDLTNEVRKDLEASLKKHNARAAKVETLLRGSNGSEQRAMNEVERSGESEEDVRANGEDQSSEEAGGHSLFVAEDEEEVSAVDSEVTGEAHQTPSAISSHKERCMVYTEDGREKFYSDPNFQEFKCSNCIQPIRVPRCSFMRERPGKEKGKHSKGRHAKHGANGDLD
ncbi:hypothetical protein B0A48_09148 [Cryoendolithus antarcticus]|uniref:Uncharacterized protein n=1 Tax=Cryoendolithus antarcticus TaxID=1507870 RepID=A0A1V8T218_9PEZI|nr:hypothetical protein B0A48_09148 [Cryoendolithus antarcticus]